MFLLDLIDQHVERPFEDRGHVSVRDPVSQQVLGLLLSSSWGCRSTVFLGLSERRGGALDDGSVREGGPRQDDRCPRACCCLEPHPCALAGRAKDECKNLSITNCGIRKLSD